MTQTQVKIKATKSEDKAGHTSAVNVMVWNLNGGAVPEKIVRRIEGAVSSIIGDCKNARLMYDVVKEQ